VPPGAPTEVEQSSAVLADPATRDNQGKDMRILRAPVFRAGPLFSRWPMGDERAENYL